MPTLILVKHSQPQIDPGIPARQWQLSTEGARRCLPLAQRLAHYQPDIIFTSVEPKAIETGKLVAKHLFLPWQIGQDLHEQERETVPFFPASEDFEAAVKRFFKLPAELVFGEETADAAHFRFAKAVATVQSQHSDQTVAIITHGTVLTLFTSRLSGMQPYPLWKSLTLPSFVVLKHRPWRLQAVVTLDSLT